jgi:hypothetical protein
MGHFDRMHAAFEACPLFIALTAMAEADDFSRLEKNAAIDQHFLPQMLLRGFSRSFKGADYVFRIEKENRREPTRVGVRSAASRQRLYEVPGAEGEPPSNIIEGYLALVETHAAPALSHLLDDPMTLPDSDRATIAFFLAHQTMRTPVAAEVINDIANSAFQVAASEFNSDRQAFAESYQRHFGKDGSPEEIERFRQETIAQIQDGRIRIVDGGGASFSLGIYWASTFAPILFDFEWTLLRAQGGVVTSDRAYAINDPTPPHPWTPQGLMSSENAETTIPLSETACLVLRPKLGSGALTVRDISTEVLTRINLRTYGWADREVYGATHEALDAVRMAVRKRPHDVIEPKPFCELVYFEADPDDTLLAEQNLRRGWPDRLEHNGRLLDYVVIPIDKPHPELRALVSATIERRARKQAGLRDDEPLDGRVVTKFHHPRDLA